MYSTQLLLAAADQTSSPSPIFFHPYHSRAIKVDQEATSTDWDNHSVSIAASKIMLGLGPWPIEGADRSEAWVGAKLSAAASWDFYPPCLQLRG